MIGDPKSYKERLEIGYPVENTLDIRIPKECLLTDDTDESGEEKGAPV